MIPIPSYSGEVNIKEQLQSFDNFVNIKKRFKTRDPRWKLVEIQIKKTFSTLSRYTFFLSFIAFRSFPSRRRFSLTADIREPILSRILIFWVCGVESVRDPSLSMASSFSL